LDRVVSFINEGREKYIGELKEFLKIPSISTLANHKNDMYTAANFVVQKLKDAGITDSKLIETDGHPLVYGEWLGALGKPTVLIYGHYDVQPVDPLNLWDTPPFEPTIRNGKIYARGATDDKGQMFMHIKSVEAYFKTEKAFPLNVKFIIEGEEEIGSANLEKFVNQNSDLLKCDTVLISDTALFAPGMPTLTYGLRGLSYMEVEVTGPNRDLHSGSFGGSVANPINILAQMISKLQNKNGKIMIPGFYDDVVKITKKEKENFNSLPFSEKHYAKDLGVKEVFGESGFSTLERIWVRPTLDCNGIIGGFTEKGAKTVLPSKASAKISMRLVPNQDPKKIGKLFIKYINQIAPKSVKVQIQDLHGAYPIMTSLEDKATIAASRAMSKAFGKKTVFMREGGSIPIVVTFAKKLKASPVLMGLGLNSENLHSPNEHFDLNHFHLGILSSAYFFDEFVKS
jgi:acetylornithine deacetylase/succinyl-diaminopimelate desuccinylase-like protein